MNSKFFPANGFSEYQNTSSKTEILDAGRNEIEFLFHHKIVTYVEKFKIPRTLVHNRDQISLKYVPVSNETYYDWRQRRQANDNGNIAITLSEKFRLMQLIYGGKTSQSIPMVVFPEGFSLSPYPKHF